MSRLTPPTSLLRAFEACARHLSVSRAAEELNLTQSAVSRQLLQLEALLDVKLFQRVRKRLVITPAGSVYAGEIRDALEKIEAATQTIVAHRGSAGTLNVAVSPTFGTRWLMPRMRSFQLTHPQIMVNLVNFTARPFPPDFAAEHIDAAIFPAVTPWAGTIAHKLIPEDFVAVCAPSLRQEKKLDTPGDIARHTLLQHTTLPDLWHIWLQRCRIEGVNGYRGPEYQHMAMVAEAAAAGIGIALLPQFLIEEEIASGRLVVAFDIPPYIRRHYFLSYPDKGNILPALRYFRNWITTEACEPSDRDPAQARS